MKSILIGKKYMKNFSVKYKKKKLNMEKIKIICTLGPASFSKPILKLLSKEKVDIFRINLSHTNTDQIEKR